MKNRYSISAVFFVVSALVWTSQTGLLRGALHNPDVPPWHPKAPDQLQATAASTTEILLSWEDNSRNETGFKIERAPDYGGTPGMWTQIATVTADVTTFTNDSLSANQTYWYRVQAYRKDWVSLYSNPVFTTTWPRPPTNLSAIAVSSNEIDLSWTPDPSGQSGFKIERAPDANGIPGTWMQIAIWPAGATDYPDGELTPGATYWYRVRAFNSTGDSAYTDPLAVIFAPPAAPSNLTAQAVGYQVGLSWSENPQGVTGFRVERAPDAGGIPGAWAQIAGWSYYLTNYIDNELTLPGTYWYRAVAYNAVGDSPYSDEVGVSVPAPETGFALVDWNDVHQRIDGFGASSAWRSSWSTAQADMFFSTTNGIGLSLLRSRITPDGSTVELGIMKMAQARGARVWSTPWSPPVAFKDSGTLNGGNYLGGDAANTAYARQLAAYAARMKLPLIGVNLYAISIQNEPNVSTTSFESCYWSGQQFHDFIPYLYNALAATNLSGIKIMLPEPYGWDLSLATDSMTDGTTSNLVGILATHAYYSPATGLDRYDKTLWETEDSTFDAFDGSISNGIYWAARIHSYLTVAEVNAWHYWWLISQNSDNEGLTDQSGNPAKRMYVVGQWSRFVRPNFYRIGVDNSSPALVSAYKDPLSGKIAIVAVNANTDVPIDQTFVLTNVGMTGPVVPWITSSNLSLASQPALGVTNSSFSWQLPPDSVVTFVGQADITNSAPTLQSTN